MYMFQAEAKRNGHTSHANIMYRFMNISKSPLFKDLSNEALLSRT